MALRDLPTCLVLYLLAHSVASSEPAAPQGDVVVPQGGAFVAENEARSEVDGAANPRDAYTASTYDILDKTAPPDVASLAEGSASVAEDDTVLAEDREPVTEDRALVAEDQTPLQEDRAPAAKDVAAVPPEDAAADDSAPPDAAPPSSNRTAAPEAAGPSLEAAPPPPSALSNVTAAAARIGNETGDADDDIDNAIPHKEEDITAPSWTRTPTEWFRIGVDAYLAEDWARCTRPLENAVIEWQRFRRANIDCRLRCAAEARASTPLFPEDVDGLQHAEATVRATLCLLKCKREAFGGRGKPALMSAAEQTAFRDLKPYEFLQLCYFQTSQLQKAASAVFTILSQNPENEIMRHNFKFYLDTQDVDVAKLVNYEAEKYVPSFVSGTEAYFSQDYETAIKNFESSIKEFLRASDECRADCEGPFDQGWLPDFVSSVANHFVYCLKCKAKCQSKLSKVNGEKYDDFLPLHYNYLQFAYFKVGKLQEACASAATFLLFYPADETMLENIQFFKSVPDIQSSMFQPRAEALNYIKRQKYEEALLKYIADEFVFEDVNEKKNVPGPEEINGENFERLSITEGKVDQRLTLNTISDERDLLFNLSINEDNQNSFLSASNLKLEAQQNTKYPLDKQHSHKRDHEVKYNRNLTDKTMIPERKMMDPFSRIKSLSKRTDYNFKAEGDLGGARRFLIDAIADTSECQHMVEFAKASGVSGDGYGGKESPHSLQEKFKGVTLGRTALMVHFGLIKITTLQLFLELSERGRSLTADYFNVPKTDLHFSYTHLVCRSAVMGKPFNESLLSHEIHADNCLLSKNGNCKRNDPAYFWRDYSALLYLNDDFEGGEFIFSADPAGRNIENSIKPSCGRLVGFSSGQENLHGVRGVRRGSRCALALWFTLDRKYAEWGRRLTEEIVHLWESGKQPQPQLIESLQDFVRFDLEEAQIQMAKFHHSNSKQDIVDFGASS